MTKPLFCQVQDRLECAAKGMALRAAAAAIVAYLSVLATAAEHQPAATAPANPLVGRWKVFSIDDKAIPAEFQLYWVIDTDHVTVTDDEGKTTSRNAYHLDTSKAPMRLVMKVKGEADRIGWCRIDRGELRITLTVGTGKPPQSWNDGVTLILRAADKQNPPATQKSIAKRQSECRYGAGEVIGTRPPWRG